MPLGDEIEVTGKVVQVSNGVDVDGILRLTVDVESLWNRSANLARRDAGRWRIAVNRGSWGAPRYLSRGAKVFVEGKLRWVRCDRDGAGKQDLEILAECRGLTVTRDAQGGMPGAAELARRVEQRTRVDRALDCGER